MTSECWLPVVGHPGYRVSNHGRVRSVDRTVLTTNGQIRRYRGVQFTCTPGKRGYPVVVLGKNGAHSVHTLELTAFVGPCPPEMEGCHDDGDPLNNDLPNLYWGTRSQNNLDAVRHGTHHWAGKPDCPRRHLLKAPNLVASKAQRGVRECWACQLARTAVRHARDRHGIAIDFRTEADLRYMKIMGRAVA